MNANEPVLLLVHSVNCCRATNAAYKQQRWEWKGSWEGLELGGEGG